MENENLLNELPDEFLNENGYPTDEILDWITKFDPRKINIYDFLDIIYDIWTYDLWGFKLYRKYGKYRKLELHTGGWSGNEDIIRALRKNMYFFSFYWRKTEVGGHYYFRIPVKF